MYIYIYIYIYFEGNLMIYQIRNQNNWIFCLCMKYVKLFWDMMYLNCTIETIWWWIIHSPSTKIVMQGRRLEFTLKVDKLCVMLTLARQIIICLRWLSVIWINKVFMHWVILFIHSTILCFDYYPKCKNS